MPVETIAREESEVASVSPDTPIHEVATMMKDRTVGSIVVEEDGRPVGIVTDRDVALHCAEKGGKLEDATADDVMSRDPVTADADSGVAELCRTMRENEVRRMPVVDETGRLTGIVTMDDLFVLIDEEIGNLAEVIQAESPPYSAETK